LGLLLLITDWFVFSEILLIANISAGRTLSGDRQPKEVKKLLKRITFTVPDDLHKSIHIYARQNDITVTDLLTQYLEELIAGQ